MTRWYLAFAVFAAALAVASGQPIERCWGTWAAIGYATGAAITAAAPRRRDRQAAAVALGCAAGCATVAPLAWQAFAGLPSRAGQGSLTVIVQAGGQLLRHGTPYLPAAGLTHVLAYDPYEPMMAVFGLPNAAGLTGWPANPRLWLALAGTAGVYLAFRIPGAPPRQALRSTALALAAARGNRVSWRFTVTAAVTAVGATARPPRPRCPTRAPRSRTRSCSRSASPATAAPPRARCPGACSPAKVQRGSGRRSPCWRCPSPCSPGGWRAARRGP